MQMAVDDQVSAVERATVEALMSTLVARFNAIGKEVWRIQDSSTKLSDDAALHIHQLYQRLARVFDEVMAYGRLVEKSGPKIAGKAEFLSAWREIKGIAAVNPIALNDSFEELRKGGGKLLGEFANELSRDLKR